MNKDRLKFGDIVYVPSINKAGTLVGESPLHRTWLIQLEDNRLVELRKDDHELILVHRETKFNLAELAKLVPKGYTVNILDDGRISILHNESVCSHYVEDEKELLEKFELISRYEAMEWI